MSSALSSSDPIVQTNGLSKFYGSFSALRDVSISAKRGKVVGLLGPNGSGKSTLLRLILGFIKPTAGSATVGGYDCYRQRDQAHRLLSYLPGDARLDRGAKGKRVLKFFSRLRPDGDLKRATSLAEQLELDLNRRVAFMSTGMRQKLALAVCLSIDAPLIILDEPTANLDPTIRQQILQLVRKAKQKNRAVVFSSHVLSEIEQSCDEVIFLRKGEKMLQNSVAELKGGHRLLANKQESIEVPAALWQSVRVVYQDATQIELEITRMDVAALEWISTQPLSEIRIESAGLQTTYDRFHGLTEIGSD